MKTGGKKNVGASVRARLLNLAKASDRDFNAVLLQYFQERFLYRLSVSPYGNNLILKGALLFLAYEMPRLRPTRDIDFLASSTPNDLENIKAIVERVSGVEAEDGVAFLADSISVERIKEDADYEGVRVKISAMLDGARNNLQLDIGFGDVIVSGPVDTVFPVLLEEQPVPRLRAYPKESVVAEKFEALVKLNFLTSRMKDVFDILYLAAHEPFEMESMRAAVVATFKARRTPLEDRGIVFSERFRAEKGKQEQWSAFLKRNRLDSFSSFAEAMVRLEAFLEPALREEKSPATNWNPADWIWQE